MREQGDIASILTYMSCAKSHGHILSETVGLHSTDLSAGKQACHAVHAKVMHARANLPRTNLAFLYTVLTLLSHG